MRKINKSVVVPKTLQNAPIPNSADEVDVKFYKADDVRKQLLDDQHNKCAYCECRITKEYNDVEHYRPKSKYYWLGHNWNNLLYSCNLCNRSCKNDDFPLANEENRITTPTDLSIEDPLIINPTTEDPTLHIQFNRHIMVGITAKGKKTIEIFRLNERRELVHDREVLFESYKRCKEDLKNMQKLLESPHLTDDDRTSINKSITLKLEIINQYKSPDTPYSGMLINK